MSVLQNLLSLMILRSAPQELPYSLQLTSRLSVLMLFTGIVVLNTTLQPEGLVEGVLLGFAVQFAFCYAVLSALNYRARFLQTFCALLGVSILFNLLSWPLFSAISAEQADDSLKATLSLVFLLLISWEVLVKAYIFKHALEMKMVGALALSFSLFFISLTLSQMLFPAQTAG